jgi:gluconolactonase
LDQAGEGAGVQGEVIADGLVFPEGPVWVANDRVEDGVAESGVANGAAAAQKAGGALYFTEIGAGRIARWDASGVTRIATTGGGPNGAAIGPSGDLYVTQNGGMTAENRVQPGILRVAQDGTVTRVVDRIGDLALEGPNDLAFGPDGRLYFTDPRGSSDPARNRRPGRLFAYDLAAERGELIAELGPVFPNGIAFTSDGTLVWTESFSRRVMARVGDRHDVLIELPERHFPDGLCLDAQGRLYVASTFGHCVTVVEAGKIVDRLVCGDGMPTNCCFGGTDLYVTESRRGTLWRFAIGASGLPLGRGTALARAHA